MEESTGFVMKNSLTLPSSASKQFNSLRDENDETIYTYNVEFMRHFIKKALKAVDVEVSINFINHLFQTNCLNFFKKIKRSR